MTALAVTAAVFCAGGWLITYLILRAASAQSQEVIAEYKAQKEPHGDVQALYGVVAERCQEAGKRPRHLLELTTHVYTDKEEPRLGTYWQWLSLPFDPQPGERVGIWVGRLPKFDQYDV